MRLSDEEKKSILEEASDRKLQDDLRLPGKSRKMSLAEYLEFLAILWKSAPRRSQSDNFIPYKKAIF